ncbi:M4 family metallopeptidase [Haloactinopolyspora alba]|nr:M4 family metallopeptidase [Haloactinopolyspora alba]
MHPRSSRVSRRARDPLAARTFALVTTAAVLAAAAPAAAAQAEPADDADTAPDTATDTAAAAPTAPGDPLPTARTDTPALVDGLSERAEADVAPDDAAVAHLEQHVDRYAIDDPGADLVTTGVTEAAGRETVRLDQSYEGVPVFGAQYVVRMETDGDERTVTGTSGSYYTDLDVDTTQQTMSADEAAVRAVRAVQRSLSPDGVVALGVSGAPTERELRTTDNGLVIMPTGDGVLARHLSVRGVRPDTGTPILQEVYLDAVSGTPLLQYSGIQSGTTDVTGTGSLINGETVDVPLQHDDETGTYIMRDTTRSTAPGRTDIVTWDATDVTAWQAQYYGKPEGMRPFISDSATLGQEVTDVGGVDAHWAAGKVHDYYLDHHGRDSLDDAGMDIDSLVGVTRRGNPWVNAYWDTEFQQMVYGSGNDEYRSLASDLDVVGHEMTHGVIQHTANLVYIGQSGALNEAFADYFGNAIDVEYTGEEMSDPDASLVGGDLCRTLSPAECALRDLDDGASTEDFQSLPVTSIADFGGVHINSTIVGGALWDLRETLGGELADAIVYRALTEYLTPTSDFTDARAAVLAAAESMGVKGKERAAIRKAFRAHGIVRGWEDTLAGHDVTRLLDSVGPGYPVNLQPSADGGWFAAPRTNVDGTAPMSIWVGRTDGKDTPRQVSPDDGRAHIRPVTDGERVIWLAEGETSQILSTPVSGGPVSVLYESGNPIGTLGLDGDLVTWSEYDMEEGLDVVYYLRDGDTSPQRVEHDWFGPAMAPVAHGDRIAYVRYDVGLPENDYTWALGVEVLDTSTGETVLAGRDELAESILTPALNSTGVYWGADLDWESEHGWVNTSIRGYDFATGKSELLIDETTADGIRALSLTASEDMLTVSVDAPVEAFQQPPSNAMLPKLYRFGLDGAPLGRASCSAGGQMFPAFDEGSRIVWIDTYATTNAVVAGDRPRGRCMGSPKPRP